MGEQGAYSVQEEKLFAAVPGFSPQILWPMQMLQVSPKDPSRLFFGMDNGIHVYSLTVDGQVLFEEKHTVPAAASETSNKDFMNSMLLGHLGVAEVIVTCHASGAVYVWNSENLQHGRMCLRCDESAWGVALHSEKRLLAVSCNAHTIRIWDMSSKQKQRIESPLGGVMSRDLRGHDNNIPGIDFSPCGNFLMSSSIDHTIRFWDVTTGSCIFGTKNFAYRLWVNRFIRFSDITQDLAGGDSPIASPKIEPRTQSIERTSQDDLVHTQAELTRDTSNPEDMIYLWGSFSFADILPSEEEQLEWQTFAEQVSDTDDDAAIEVAMAGRTEMIDEHDVSLGIFESASDSEPVQRTTMPWIPIEASLSSNAERLSRIDARFSDYLLLQTNQSIVTLHDVNNSLLEIDQISMSTFGVRHGQLHFDRVSFLQWIPALSLAVVASQRGNVQLCRLVRRSKGTDRQSVHLMSSRRLPGRYISNLHGITAIPIGTEADCTSWRIYIAYDSGHLSTYKLIRRHREDLVLPELVF